MTFELQNRFPYKLKQAPTIAKIILQILVEKVEPEPFSGYILGSNIIQSLPFTTWRLTQRGTPSERSYFANRLLLLENW